jgi:dsRNA-specific ribonuclease
MEFKEKQLIPIYNTFKECIVYLMKNYLKLDDKYIDMWTTPENMKKFENAFTAQSYDDDKDEKSKINSKVNNYEFYEIVGDACLNKNFVYYIQERFPQFRNTEGVKYISKLKLLGISKKIYHMIAEPLGIYPWIRASEIEKSTNKNKLLEDVLESFIGCFELIVNEKYYQLGSPLVYNFVKTLFDKMEISTNLEKITDPKSRVKEIFDKLKLIGWKIRTENKKIPIETEGKVSDKFEHISEIYITPLNKSESLFGTGKAFKLNIAESMASQQAEQKLKSEYNITHENTVHKKGV